MIVTRTTPSNNGLSCNISHNEKSPISTEYIPFCLLSWKKAGEGGSNTPSFNTLQPCCCGILRSDYWLCTPLQGNEVVVVIRRTPRKFWHLHHGLVCKLPPMRDGPKPLAIGKKINK